MKTQASELSALFDGELEPHAVRAVVRAAVTEEDLHARWRIYALIGDQLRGERLDPPDLTSSIMARIEAEPVVLAPRKLIGRPAHRHPLLALAASVAGVAVVGWLALAGNSRQDAAFDQMAAVSPQPTFAPAAAPRPQAPAASATHVAAAPLRGEMSEYLLAHHAHAAGLRIGDGVRQVRAVALGDRVDRQ